jgi:predicted glycoside hydrolase/deacetylase ChbG (UPF0249 family)
MTEPPPSRPSLAERLGYDAGDRLLILSCDELGTSHAANVGTYDALRAGLAATAALMVPAPWAREAAARHRGEDVGVQLTLNADWELLRWGPITWAPSLLDGDGGFPRTVEDLWEHADLDEVRRELKAQVERAILWGFDVTHLAPHRDAITLRPEFFDVCLDLAIEFRLPLRLAGAEAERVAGFPFRQLAADEGVIGPDHLVRYRGIGARAALEAAVRDLAPGVTELALRPAIDSPELRAAAPGWAGRVDDHDLLTADGSLRVALEAAGVHLVGYRALRDLAHTQMPVPVTTGFRAG